MTNSMEAKRFEIGTDTFTDTKTGLIWQKEPSEPMAHAEALVYAAEQGGCIPTVDELMTLVDLSRSWPTTWPELVPLTPIAQYWTSEPVADDTSGAWYAYFAADSYVFNFPTSGIGRVRCVLGGK